MKRACRGRKRWGATGATATLDPEACEAPLPESRVPASERLDSLCTLLRWTRASYSVSRVPGGAERLTGGVGSFSAEISISRATGGKRFVGSGGKQRTAADAKEAAALVCLGEMWSRLPPAARASFNSASTGSSEPASELDHARGTGLKPPLNKARDQRTDSVAADESPASLSSTESLIRRPKKRKSRS